jgi:hypothetical protein
VPANKVTTGGASDRFSSASFPPPPATQPCVALPAGTNPPQGTYCGNSFTSGKTMTSGTSFRGATTINGGTWTFGSASGSNLFYFDGGLTISNGTVTFNPGTYYIEGGTFTINGGAVVTGTGVTFVLTNSTLNPAYAKLNVSGSPSMSVNLTAPSTGTTTGIVFFGDRNAPTTNTDSISGNGSVTIDGAFYFPTQNFSISGNGVSASPCTEVVALTILDTGNGAFSSNCSSVGLSGNTTAQLVE